MSDYMQIYTAVDKDNKGYITISDLEKYAKQHGMNPKIAQKWQIEFDPQNTGRITLEKFCDVLNVDAKEVTIYRQNSTYSNNVTVRTSHQQHSAYDNGIVISAKQQDQQHAAVPSGKIRVLDQEMSERMMEDTLNITKQYISEYPSDLKARAGALKKYMEHKYGDCWHCFIMQAGHGYHYSHKPNCSIAFSCDDYYYVLFCTPLN